MKMFIPIFIIVFSLLGVVNIELCQHYGHLLHTHPHISLEFSEWFTSLLLNIVTAIFALDIVVQAFYFCRFCFRNTEFLHKKMNSIIELLSPLSVILIFLSYFVLSGQDGHENRFSTVVVFSYTFIVLVSISRLGLTLKNTLVT